jgi:hypothetical protein
VSGSRDMEFCAYLAIVGVADAADEELELLINRASLLASSKSSLFLKSAGSKGWHLSFCQPGRVTTG